MFAVGLAVYNAKVRLESTRTESGCTDISDKAKHVRCTEELPKCHRCERLGLHCERGLQLLFQEDAVQRGISFGRKGAFCLSEALGVSSS